MSYAQSSNDETFPSDSSSTERSPAFLPRGAALSVLWLYDASETPARSLLTHDDHDGPRASDTPDTRP